MTYTDGFDRHWKCIYMDEYYLIIYSCIDNISSLKSVRVIRLAFHLTLIYNHIISSSNNFDFCS